MENVRYTTWIFPRLEAMTAVGVRKRWWEPPRCELTVIIECMVVIKVWAAMVAVSLLQEKGENGRET